MKKLVLILVFGLGFFARLYRINAPLADWHSFRQADTASVSREFIKQGFNLLKPKYHDLSNIQSGQHNLEGYRMVEFPIYNFIHGLFYRLTKNWVSLETAGRLVSITASLFSAYFLFLIVKKELNWLTGVLTAGFFLFLPFSIFYSRTILPDSLMVALSLGSIYFLTKSKTYLSLIFGALALLTKPYALFLVIPGYLVICVKKINLKSLLRAAGYGFIITLPLFGWRLWIKQFPEGIPANQWLLNQNNIRLRPAWWRWLFDERLGQLILGTWGIILFGLGLITKINDKYKRLFYALLGGIFAYLVIFAWGNVQHDYYQIITIPVVAVFLAKGSYFLLHPPKNISIIPSYLLLITSLLFGIAFSWYQVQNYYKINHPEIVTAGKKADELLPEDAKVIAPYQGDTAFLYQTNRRGWPAVTGDINELIKMGAEYYVAVNFDQTTAELKERCQVLEENDRFIIINLKQCNNIAI